MRYIISLIMSALLSSPAAALAGYANVEQERIHKGHQGRYGHLEYFGFYASAMRHWNFTAELAPFTNLTWIEVASTDEAVARVAEARDNGVKAVLSVQAFAFDSEYRLKSDYAGTLAELQQHDDFPRLQVRTRSGDTTQTDRQRMLRKPPDILITTPESLTNLLTTVRGRTALQTIETIIFDEVHSLVDNRRGVSLLSSTERRRSEATT